MATHVCERCGGDGSVMVAKVHPDRGGERGSSSEHRYCRDCAIAIGVPLRKRGEVPEAITEPPPPTWPDIETFLAHYEQILREEPSLRDNILDMAHHLLRYSRHIPTPMPDAVSAAFARIGVSDASSD